MKSVRERMDIISAYREVGSYRGAAEICATTAKIVKRMAEAAQCSDADSPTRHNEEGADHTGQCSTPTRSKERRFHLETPTRQCQWASWVNPFTIHEAMLTDNR